MSIHDCSIATLIVALTMVLAGCNTSEVKINETYEPVVSLDGRSLLPPEFGEVRRAELEKNYSDALQEFRSNPEIVESHIWLGRRAAYLWRYREAIEVFSKAIDEFPDEPRLYRHRGHRYITVREYDRAIADFEQAVTFIEGSDDTVEPDGAPNAAGIPVSTLHTNIWYHLGLAYYLQGRFDDAASAFGQCLDLSTNDDMKVASSDWLYMSLRRAGRNAEASIVLDPIHGDVELLENHSYLKRLMMYKGEVHPDSVLRVGDGPDRDLTLATQGYGVGNWYLYSGDTSRAFDIFDEVVMGEYWPAFGYIAAEADIFRSK